MSKQTEKYFFLKKKNINWGIAILMMSYDFL